MKRLIVGITGATGAVFGIRLLEALQGADVETHLILSKWAMRTIEHEASSSVKQVRELASVVHDSANMGASVSSGSFVTDGMVIIPCSMRTVAAIAQGAGDHLIHRAADVVLKERRKLLLVARETPLSDLHLENLLRLSRMGVTIMPPVPAFYNHPKTLDDMVNHIVARVLDQFAIPAPFARRWDGSMQTHSQRQPAVAGLSELSTKDA